MCTHYQDMMTCCYVVDKSANFINLLCMFTRFIKGHAQMLNVARKVQLK